MKVRELIIGDLVLYFGQSYGIIKVDPESELCIIEDATSFEQASIHDLSPIPLTPEILEKNEWKKSKINDCAYFYYKDGLFLTYTSKDGKFWFDDFDYSISICVDLPYVHSLQHLLFGLGINSEMEV